MADNELVLLDTNILVRLIRNDMVGRRVQQEHRLGQRPERPLISVVTAGEIRSLALKFGWAKGKRDALAALLGQLVQVRLTQGNIVDRYAEIDYYSRHELKPSHTMGQNDMWIAATASVVGARLFTTDTDYGHLVPKFINLSLIDAKTGETK